MTSRTEQTPVTNECGHDEICINNEPTTRLRQTPLCQAHVKRRPIRRHGHGHEGARLLGPRKALLHFVRTETRLIPKMSRSCSGRSRAEQRHRFRARYPKRACPSYLDLVQSIMGCHRHAASIQKGRETGEKGDRIQASGVVVSLLRGDACACGGPGAM
ncbi:uncharacterized protein M421DRAFT_95706 [Didymella exigua CBS 183.55]|uniref:Uncharacterized protein n=1 Tax=Didymella exigua CBS 183.55 TaxID=1150837 RepID=A0A6A5R9Y9_9PLEO|nr:uncharacterized protein M421DRAFT_95706 [Didymella exigua CBS 183.55]KAF1924018.1 hypothetical protein M421DRAFT_95706 [Didymella exigua CBS 183.55]